MRFSLPNGDTLRIGSVLELDGGQHRVEWIEFPSPDEPKGNVYACPVPSGPTRAFKPAELDLRLED